MVESVGDLDLNIGEVDEAVKQRLKDLVAEFRDCFSTSINELGTAKGVEMKIKLSNETPLVHILIAHHIMSRRRFKSWLRNCFYAI